jgi:hypothetical protein
VGDTGLKDIFVQSGFLTFSRSTVMGDPSRTIFVYPGATFRMHRTPEFSANNLNKAVSMTNAFIEVESNGLTNTFLGPITMTGTNTINLPAATGLIVQNSSAVTARLTSPRPAASLRFKAQRLSRSGRLSRAAFSKWMALSRPQLSPSPPTVCLWAMAASPRQ